MQTPTIRKDIYVTVFFIASKNKESFMLEEGLEYGDITDAIFQDDQVQMHLSGQLLLSVANGLGWEHQLYDGVTLGQMSLDKLTVNRLHDQDIIIVRVKNDRVGGRELLVVMLHEHEKQPVLKSRLKYLCNSYCGYRLIKHDGNDYFRAVYFALFESFIVMGKRHMFSQLQERFHNLLSEMHSENAVPSNKTLYSFDETMTYLNYVIKILDEAAENTRWQTVQELEADLLDEEYELDIMFVLMLRRLTSQFIIENKHMKLANNGTTSLEDIILDAFPNYSNLKEYCEECVNKADVPISGPVAGYGCLFYAVNLQGTIALVDKSKEVKLSLTTVGVTNSDDGDEDACFGKVHLLLRQGNYDILYTNDDIYSSDESGVTSPLMGSPALHHQKSQFGQLTRQQSSAAPAARRPSMNASMAKMANPAAAAAAATSAHPSASPPTSRRPSMNASMAKMASQAAPAPAPAPAAPAQPESISMETMKTRFEALGVDVTDMNVIYEVCQNCKTVEQGIAYYYKNIVPRSSSPPRSDSNKSSNKSETQVEEKEVEAPPPSKGPSRVNSGLEVQPSSKGPSRASSGIPSVDGSVVDATSPMNASVASAGDMGGDPLAGNDQYIHRQFLALLKVGFDIDQILEAIDVGQCATFDIALGYLRRKMKYAQEHGGGTVAKPKLVTKSSLNNMTFSDLRVESELEGVKTQTQSPPVDVSPAPPAVVMPKKTSMWAKLKATTTNAPPPPDPVAAEEEMVDPAVGRAPTRVKTTGVSKLQGLMQKGALTGKAPAAKSGGISLSNVKSMVAKMKAQAAIEEEAAQQGQAEEDYEDEDEDEANERITHMPDSLARNTVTVNTVVPRAAGRGAPSGMGNYASPPMNNSMYQQPKQNASMYQQQQQPMMQPPMNGSMYQQPMQAPPPRPAPVPVHAMNQQMPQTMYQQPMQQQLPMAPAPRGPTPRPAMRAPRPQAPSLNVNNFSEEQRIIYQKLLNMQQPQAEAMRLAAKFTTIDEFCDYMEKQRAPPAAPQVQVQAAPGAGKKGWGALKMFKK